MLRAKSRQECNVKGENTAGALLLGGTFRLRRCGIPAYQEQITVKGVQSGSGGGKTNDGASRIMARRKKRKG